MTRTPQVERRTKKRAMDDPELEYYGGWITPIFAELTDKGYHLAKRFIGTRDEAQRQQRNPEFTKARGPIVDSFVIVCLVLQALSYVAVASRYLWLSGSDPESIRASITIASTGLIVSIFVLLNAIAAAFRISLFDSWFNDINDPPAVASHPRIVILGLINFIQIMVGFGTVYAIDPELVAVPDSIRRDMIDPLYLSCMTQMTIGYGDRHPEGWLRIVAIIQSLCVTGFLIVYLPRAIGIMPPIASIEDRVREKLRLGRKRLRNMPRRPRCQCKPARRTNGRV